MNSFELERIRLTSLEVGWCHTASSDVRCSTSRLGFGGMAQTITAGGDEETKVEGSAGSVHGRGRGEARETYAAKAIEVGAAAIPTGS